MREKERERERERERKREREREREKEREKERKREREKKEIGVVTWQASAESVERLFRLTGVQQGQPKVVKDFCLLDLQENKKKV